MDTRNYVDQKYWNSLYFNKSKEYNNNTSFIPQNSLAILAHKEINNLVNKFQRNHLILLHHHNSGAFRLPCKINRDETSSHKWDYPGSNQIYIFTLRDSLSRTISMIKHSFSINSVFQSPNTENSKYHKNGPIWMIGLDSDSLPYDRRPAIEMLSVQNNLRSNDTKLIEFALEIIPELATYQLR